ncbi:MAG: hypothetical protein ACKOBW_07550 [Planctomycetota bacterium]
MIGIVYQNVPKISRITAVFIEFLALWIGLSLRLKQLGLEKWIEVNLAIMPMSPGKESELAVSSPPHSASLKLVNHVIHRNTIEPLELAGSRRILLGRRRMWQSFQAQD